MIQAIQYRKSHFLGTKEWSTVPWLNCSKGIRQRLYDIGFQLAATIEDVDRLAESQSSGERATTFSKGLTRFSRIDSDLNIWYEKLCREYEILYWKLPSEQGQAKDRTELSGTESFVFPDMDRAHVMTLFWTLRLTVSIFINQICVRFMAEAKATLSSPSFPSQSSRPMQIGLPTAWAHSSQGSPIPIQLVKFVYSMTQAHNAYHRLALASNVVRSVPYFLRDEMGLMAAHTILFPIRTSLYELQDSKPGFDFVKQDTPQGESLEAPEIGKCYQSEKGSMLIDCQILFDRLIESKGLGYARQVGRSGRRWGKPMPSNVDKIIESGEVDSTL